ncbi:MAG: pantoate--beta-alanine ligase [Saprospiraceae bacterium]|nr:pantoate--beta-alanine ligase [Saprospiraceae bacterium]
MKIFRKVKDLQTCLEQEREAGRHIGFAPTMGALHDGHLELIRMAKRDETFTVASIFVNPTQFNDPKDLEKYPRMPEKDAELLLSVHCDALFMPTVDEVYPPGKDLTLHLDFGALATVMEGEFRPGHFQGMATVVNRLLDIVKPDKLYMGQKDYQQLCIVRNMIGQLQLPVELVMCPTVREADGLAMSSRNLRLTPDMRAAAPIIYASLQALKTEFKKEPAAVVIQKATDRIAGAGLRPEYVEVVNGITLQSVQNWHDAELIVACVAAFAGEIRLIDNLVVKGHA